MIITFSQTPTRHWYLDTERKLYWSTTFAKNTPENAYAVKGWEFKSDGIHITVVTPVSTVIVRHPISSIEPTPVMVMAGMVIPIHYFIQNRDGEWFQVKKAQGDFTRNSSSSYEYCIFPYNDNGIERYIVKHKNEEVEVRLSGRF